MNNSDRKILEEFPKALDAAIIKKFGEHTEAHSYYDFLGSMRYVTAFKSNSEEEKQRSTPLLRVGLLENKNWKKDY